MISNDVDRFINFTLCSLGRYLENRYEKCSKIKLSCKLTSWKCTVLSVKESNLNYEFKHFYNRWYLKRRHEHEMNILSVDRDFVCFELDEEKRARYYYYPTVKFKISEFNDRRWPSFRYKQPGRHVINYYTIRHPRYRIDCCLKHFFIERTVHELFKLDKLGESPCMSPLMSRNFCLIIAAHCNELACNLMPSTEINHSIDTMRL